MGLIQTMALGDKLEFLLDHTFLLISILTPSPPVNTAHQQSDEQEFCAYLMFLWDTQFGENEMGNKF